MNATLDENNWNMTMDVSTMGDDQGGRTRNFDSTKQTVSVEIKDLCSIPDGNDKLTIGLYDFSKVAFRGKVINVEDEEESVTYVVADVEENSYSIRCCVYNTSHSYGTRFVEGSVVRVCGKLHYLDSRLEVIVHTIQEVEDLAEVECEKWGARLVKLEFGRGLLGLLYSDPLKFSGIKNYSDPKAIKTEGQPTGGNGSVNSNNSLALGERIIRYLKENGLERFKVDEMAVNLNVPVEQIVRAAEALEREGNLFMDGEGCYGLGC
uniref:RPA_C domain-containing protein n=1 Tax=Strongyloides stercoralis TaxID=6248 RepID=A0A0K0E3R9_STRER